MPTYAYWVLASLRFITAGLTGYIHPDEYFQTAEIAAGTLAHFQHWVPWEFQPSGSPSRSIVPVFLTSGVPFACLRALSHIGQRLGYEFTPSTYFIFLVQRMWCALVSFVIDWTVYRALCRSRRDPKPGLLLVATSHVTLTFLTHAFTNGLETVWLCLLVLYLNDFLSVEAFSKAGHVAPRRRLTRPQGPSFLGLFGFGLVVGLGLFTRITFLAFAFPLIITFIKRLYCDVTNANPKLSWYRRWTRVLNMAKGSLVGFGTACIICLLADGYYFGTLSSASWPTIWSILKNLPFQWRDTQLWRDLSRYIVIAPLNNLLYNLDQDNLADHGLHPRYLHVVVNYPLLFGPLVIFLLRSVWRLVTNPCMAWQRLTSISMYTGSLIFATGLLSAIPHQEPRFLLPLLPSLVIVVAPSLPRLASYFWRWWWGFNLVMVLVFGVLHQAGIIPALAFIQSTALPGGPCTMTRHLPWVTCTRNSATWSPISQASTVSLRYHTRAIFYRTLMPPRHLLGPESIHRRGHSGSVNVIDLQGGPRQRLLQYLEKRYCLPDLQTNDGFGSETVYQQLDDTSFKR
ncbi:alpha 1,2 mannosyltransferase [Dispira parvispora]|uniref:Mannosyltransferase n=1 Tax=Dispira parvispora TaxID=1520584 RepID=A0A9W8AU38_9FUNG|nr:alpha 1,2 mannosyltransferase [Dispira parvispora]